MVADVVAVEELVEVVKGLASRKADPVFRAIADGVPSGLAERAAESETAGAEERGVPLEAVDPHPRLEGGGGELADPAAAPGGNPGGLRRPAPPRAGWGGRAGCPRRSSGR